MEPVVIGRGTASPAACRERRRLALGAGLAVVLGVLVAQSPARCQSESVARPASILNRPATLRPALKRTRADAPKSQAPPAPPAAVAPKADAERYSVHDETGRDIAARLHGRYGDRTVIELPDGQLGIPNILIPTDQPFQPMTMDEVEETLHSPLGPFAQFQLLKTEHYLIFYQTSQDFARDSGRLLEDLYKGLIEAFRRNGFPVRDAEFPLVAVAYKSEADYRKNKRVDPEVQACYEFYSNRIFFYQHSEREKIEPKLSYILKPQTVAHEGAHQILANIGVQPRLSEWPLWLVEGLAEYCATTTKTKKGIVWSGLGAINAPHMATLRELEDPVSIQIAAANPVYNPYAAPRRRGSRAEALVMKTKLTATDYALAWAMTHYLAAKRGEEFVDYLKAMNRIPPLEPRTPDQQLELFKTYFGSDMIKLDKKIDEAVHKLSQKKGYDKLPYYAVIFEQALGNGVIRRAGMVSQSPQMVQQWVVERMAAQGTQPNWQVLPVPTRARATVIVENWVNGR